MYQKIDVETWGRRADYTFFIQNPCTVHMSANVDITGFADYAKARGLSLYICILYSVCLCVNEIDGFRMTRVREGGELVPVIYDVLNPNYPVKGSDGNPVNMLAEFTRDFGAFYNTIERGIKEARAQKENIFHTGGFFLTSYVAYPFTSTVVATGEESVKPCVIWGKYITEGGAKKLPVTISHSHAFIGGEQFVEFFTGLERCFNDPESVLKCDTRSLK